MAKTAKRELVQKAARRLQQVGRLAELAAEGPEPRQGAKYLADVLEEVGAMLRRGPKR